MREYTFSKKSFGPKVLGRVKSSSGIFTKYLSDMGEIRWK